MAVVSLDIRRAFDQVPHQALLTSFQHRKVPDILLHVFKSYLRDRTQFVKVGQTVS